MTPADDLPLFWSPTLPNHWITVHDGQLVMYPDIQDGERAARPFRGHWRSLRAASTPHVLALQFIRADNDGSRDALLSLSEAAAVLGVTPQRASQLVAEGRLPAWRAGATRIVRARDLDAVRDRKRTGRPKST